MNRPYVCESLAEFINRVLCRQWTDSRTGELKDDHDRVFLRTWYVEPEPLLITASDFAPRTSTVSRNYTRSV